MECKPTDLEKQDYKSANIKSITYDLLLKMKFEMKKPIYIIVHEALEKLDKAVVS